MKEEWWMTCRKMTVLVISLDGIVTTGSAPIVKRFAGQPIGNLRQWMMGFGGFKQRLLKEK